MSRTAVDIEALFVAHRETLLAFFARRTADPQIATDLWAETFAQAVVSAKRYRGRDDADAAAWLFGIARRQLAAYYRRGSAEQRALRRLSLERPAVSPVAEAEIMRLADMAELRRAVADALGTLGDGVREAVQLRVVADLPYIEVAGRLRISEDAARARVSRGLKALAGLIDRAYRMEVT